MLTDNYNLQASMIREVVRTIYTVTDGDLHCGYQFFILDIHNGDATCLGRNMKMPIKISAWVINKCTKLIEG